MPNSRRRSRDVARAVAIVSLGATLLVGCGNRNPYDELVADAQGSSAQSVATSQNLGAGAAAPAPAAVGGGGAVAPTTTTTTVQGQAPATAPGAGSVAAKGNSPRGPVGAVVQAPAATCSGQGAPIVIGSVGQQSGIGGTFFTPGVQAVRAWVAAKNAAGGLNCHPVKFVVADDGGDPAQNLAVVQQLVERDHVIAFVYQTDVFAGMASSRYLMEKRIPVIGTTGGNSAAYYDSPMVFPQLASADGFLETAFAGASFGAGAGKKIATLNCIEAPLCSNMYNLAPGFAKKYGLDLVYRGQVSIAAPDYTSNCAAAKQAGAQILLLMLDGNSDQRVARSCNSVIYRPQLALFAITLTASHLADPNLAGALIGSPLASSVDTSNAGVAELRSVMAKFAPGVDPGNGAMSGWASAKLFELAAGQIRADATPASADVLAGLWSVKKNDLGGMTSPLTFVKDHPASVPFCYWVLRVEEGGKESSPNGGKRTCDRA